MPFGIGLEVLKTEISNQMWWGLCLGCCVWHFAVFKIHVKQMVNSFTYVRDKLGTF
jgi:hypothetical protein